MHHFAEHLNSVVRNHSTCSFIVLLSVIMPLLFHYGVKVGLITKSHCTLDSIFTAFLIPILLYSCFRFYCTPVTDFTAFSDSGDNIIKTLLLSRVHLVFGEDEFAWAFDFDFEDEGVVFVYNDNRVVDAVGRVAVEAEVAGNEAFV